MQAEGEDGRVVPAYGSLIVPSFWVHAESLLELHVTEFGRLTLALPNILVQPAEPNDPMGVVDVPIEAFPPRDSE